MNRILDFLFPEKCACCGEVVEYGRGTPFCRTCLVKWESEKFRLRKAFGEVPVFEYAQPDGVDRNLGRVICTVPYNPEDKSSAAACLLFKLKRHATKRVVDFAAMELSSLLREALPELFCQGIIGTDVVIAYVPRRRESTMKYGYDHMELCARAVAKRVNVRCFPLLKRQSGAYEQKHLGREGRAENAHKSIYLSRKFNIDRKTVILLDDIVTTGASLNACAELLYEAGAKLVVTAALAVTRREI